MHRLQLMWFAGKLLALIVPAQLAGFSDLVSSGATPVEGTHSSSDCASTFKPSFVRQRLLEAAPPCKTAFLQKDNAKQCVHPCINGQNNHVNGGEPLHPSYRTVLTHTHTHTHTHTCAIPPLDWLGILNIQSSSTQSRILRGFRLSPWLTSCHVCKLLADLEIWKNSTQHNGHVTCLYCK